MLLGFGVACALFEAGRSGRGQVVDAAMVDGTALLAAMFSGFLAAGTWSEERGANILDTGAPWYDVYQTKDAKFVCIGAIEAKFYAELVAKLQLQNLPAQHDRSRWHEMRARFAAAFKAKTRDEWCRVFDGSDACFAPVLAWSEARRDPHNASRKTFIEVGALEQPAPAPRFSRTPGEVRRPPPERGAGGRLALADWGLGAAEVEELCRLGVNFRA
jgi:alpha-methylacyl-CoA racemase